MHPAVGVDRLARGLLRRPNIRASRCSRACTARRACRAGRSRRSSGSTILISTCGCTRPTVLTRFSTSSSTAVWVESGAVSVMPHAIVTSSMCICARTWFMTSTGHGAPAMIPVRRLERSNSPMRGCSSSAMNIVGTPYSEVQRSSSTACSVASGSKFAPGTTTQAPWVTHARLAEHHAEAVVERHRRADAVVLCVAQQQPREVAVVEDVAVRQRGALRGAGRARGELDVDRVAGIERRLDRGEVAPRARPRRRRAGPPSRPRGRASRAAAGSAGAPRPASRRSRPGGSRARGRAGSPRSW